MGKNRMSAKLVSSALMLVLAAVMLTVGTFAWHTISTVAEAGDLAIIFGGKYPIEASLNYDPKTESGTWLKQIDVSALLDAMNATAELTADRGAAPLRPITTADLEHWYSAEYAGDGSVQTFSLEQLDAIANKMRVTGTDTKKNAAGVEETDASGNPIEISVDKGTNCLIYFDMYVRASVEGERWGMKLSTASKNSDGTYGDQMVTEEQDYGTYVMTKPKAVVAEGKNMYEIDEELAAKDALNSLRIGFAQMVTDEDTGEEHVERFIIYEPNADTHNSTMSTQNEELYRITDAKGTTGTSVKDYVAAVASEAAGLGNATSEGRLVTLVPEYVSPTDTRKEVTAEDKALGYRMVRQMTLQQRASKWISKSFEITHGTHWSKYVKEFGTFYPYVDEFDGLSPFHETVTVTVPDPEGEEGATKEESTTYTWTDEYYYTLCNLTYDEPVKVRVFIWIEGQDIDCWNQIMGGEILANFEFVAGDPYDYETKQKIDCKVEISTEEPTPEASTEESKKE